MWVCDNGNINTGLQVWGIQIENISWQVFAASLQTKGTDCNSSSDLIISPFYTKIHCGSRKQCKLALGESRCKCWMDIEAAPSLPPQWEKGFNSAEAPQRRQQKRFTRDAPRWHHVKSIRDKVDIFNYSGTSNPTPPTGVNYEARTSA